MGELKRLLYADFYGKYKEQPTLVTFLKYYIISISFRSITRYRIQTILWGKKNKVLKFISIMIRNNNIKKYGLEIGLNARIGSGFVIHHVNGIVIGEGVIIGENLNIFHQVTIGQKDGYYPQVGNNVTIFSGAKIIGGIIVGDNVVIGANSFISRDVDINSIVYGNNKLKN